MNTLSALPLPLPNLINLLKKAIFLGSEAAIRGYLQRGGQPDARDSNGMTLLMLAASRDQAAICTHLLAAGANPALSLSASHPLTALEIAQRTRSLAAMPVLEQAVKQRASAGMLLRRAAAVGSVLAVRRHIQRGDNLNATGRSGLTPLMLAALKNHAEICAALCQAGADATLLSPAGLTACELAAEANAMAAWAVLSPPPAVAVVAPPVLSPPVPEAAAPVTPALPALPAAVTPTAAPAAADLAPPVLTQPLPEVPPPAVDPALTPPALTPPRPETLPVVADPAPLALTLPVPEAATPVAPENIPSPPVLAQEATEASSVMPTPADWVQVLDNLLPPRLVAENAMLPVAVLEWVRPTWAVGLPVAWAQVLADVLSPDAVDAAPPEPAVAESAESAVVASPPSLPAPPLVPAQEAADSPVSAPNAAPESIAVADAADQAEETEDEPPLLLALSEPVVVEVESADALLADVPPSLLALPLAPAQEAADSTVSVPNAAPESIAVADAAEEAHPLLLALPEPIVVEVESAGAPPLEEELLSLFCWEAREEPCLPAQDAALVAQYSAIWQQIADHTPRHAGVEWFDASLAAVTAEQDASDTANPPVATPVVRHG